MGRRYKVSNVVRYYVEFNEAGVAECECPHCNKPNREPGEKCEHFVEHTTGDYFGRTDHYFRFKPTVRDIANVAGWTYQGYTSSNYYFDNTDKWTFDEVMESGKSYMAGSDYPMEKFKVHYRSPLTAWQKLAFEWCREHPDKVLCLDNRTKEWRVCWRNDHCEFGLPHQDFGGERHYVSQNGLSKYHVNED